MKRLIDFIYEKILDNNEVKAFTIIKPGFTKYKDEIYDYINKKGFILNKETNLIKLTDKQITDLYGCHSKEDWYNDLCKYMGSGEIYGANWKFDYEKNPGTNTISLMKDIKHHFRDKYGKDKMRNCMHSSDSLNNVQRESKIII